MGLEAHKKEFISGTVIQVQIPWLGWGGVGWRWVTDPLSVVISLNDHAVKLPSKSLGTDLGCSQPWPEKLLSAVGSSQCEISENWS